MLKQLPREVQDRIAGWCREDGYESARQRCLAELGVETWESSLCSFYRWHSLRAEFERATATADAASELMRGFDPADAARAEAFGQFVFTQAAVAAQDPKVYVALESLRLDKETAAKRAEIEEKKLALAERRVAVMEQKLAKLKGALEDGGLTAEERERRMKEVFGL